MIIELYYRHLRRVTPLHLTPTGLLQYEGGRILDLTAFRWLEMLLGAVIRTDSVSSVCKALGVPVGEPGILELTTPTQGAKTMAKELTAAQKSKLTAAGIDWQKVLDIVKPFGLLVLQLLLTMLEPKPVTGGKLKELSDACPCPGPDDGLACCHAAQTHILLAALCVEGHCCKDDCCPEDCCTDALHHLLNAVDCVLTCCAK